MARKKKEEEHENLERWLISYADFITLLFALFVVLYAISEVDVAKLKKVASSFQFAFGIAGTEGVEKVPVFDFRSRERYIPLPVKGVDEISHLYYPEEAEGFERIKQAAEPLFQKDAPDGRKVSPVAFDFTERGLILRFNADYLFSPASSEIRREARFPLRKTVEILKEAGTVLTIEGHTDNQPVAATDYPSNWELSAARASAMVKFFVDQCGFSPKKISIGAYGDARPISVNETEEGRSANRRMNILAMTKWERGNEP
ncbi:MAG: OmpA family protein [Nitrospinae bacterium]|nr:OmpA family protein [Nitrospinota bacterium]